MANFWCELWAQIRRRPRAAWIAGALWLALWVLTAATWLYGPDGQSFGMQPAVFAVHLVAPIAVAVLVGWWQETAAAGVRAGAFAGALFAALNMAALLIFSGVMMWLGRAQGDPQMSWWEGAFEALHMGLAYVIWGAVWGLLGGLVGALLPQVIFRRKEVR